jgi:hypothetical protein
MCFFFLFSSCRYRCGVIVLLLCVYFCVSPVDIGVVLFPCCYMCFCVARVDIGVVLLSCYVPR